MGKYKDAVFCAAAHCDNNSKDQREVSYFAFPKDDEMRAKWIKASGREDLRFYGKKKNRLCGKHFSDDSFTSHRRNRLKKTAIPTLNLSSDPFHRHETEQKFHPLLSIPLESVRNSTTDIAPQTATFKQLNQSDQVSTCKTLLKEGPSVLVQKSRPAQGTSPISLSFNETGTVYRYQFNEIVSENIPRENISDADIAKANSADVGVFFI